MTSRQGSEQAQPTMRTEHGQTFDPAVGFRETAARIEEEVGKVIVGQRQLVREVLTCLVAGGNGLLEGVPGLGKTMLVRTLALVLDCSFDRIQFTPDMMPADIIGTNIINEAEDGKRRFEFQEGPVFANLVLADEINRATPKTQSALLEAMQEGTVSIARNVYPLPQPFFVLATQNPLEMEGTYPLPEAQLDRFFFKMLVPFPTGDELATISERTTSGYQASVHKATDGATIAGMQNVARQTPIAAHVTNYAVRILLATHPDQQPTPMVKKYVRYGGSPRGLQAMITGAKITALLDGRYNVAYKDIRAVAIPALRHRIILNFDGEAEGISTDSIVRNILEEVREEEKLRVESNAKMKEGLPPGASEASIMRYQLAQELALRCPAALGQEIALTGSASRGVSDEVSDIEINFWAEQIPTEEQQLAWLNEIGATDIFPNVATEADGSIMTTFTYQGIIVEAEWQMLAQQEQVLQTLLAAKSDSQWLILNGEMITSAVPLRTDGVLAHWKQMVADYPDAMVAKVVASATEGWSFRHWVDLRWAYIKRREFLVLQRTIDSDLGNALRILWAINRQWGPQLKWVRHSAPALKVKPERLVERIEEILVAPPKEAVTTTLQLVLEVLALVPPQFEVSKPIEIIRASLQSQRVEDAN